MRRSKLLLLLVAALVVGCKSATEEPLNSDPESAVVVSEVGQTFDLRPGQTARVGGNALLIGFRGVAQDSRCPTDVTCVWAGDAELRIQATVGRMAWSSFTLHTNLQPQSARFRENTITVLGLRPAPRSTDRIPSGSYVVTLRVD